MSERKSDKQVRVSPHRKNDKPVRISEELWEALDKIVARQKGKLERRNHTHLVNEMVAAAAAKWLYSPYVCHGAYHIAFVTADGHVLFRTVQKLLLNSDRNLLPVSVRMKPEKRDYFLRQHNERSHERLRLASIESRWIINHFAVWRGKEPQGEPLSSAVDRLGLEAKVADLPVSGLQGESLTREIVAGWRDYVQREERRLAPDTSRYDRLAYNIDIPTTSLQCFVFVDQNLYPPGLESPDLEIELRNRERARFREKEAVYAFEENRPKEHSSVGTKSENPELAAQLEGFLNRLRELADARIKGRPVVKNDDAKLIRSLAVPERFLYLRLDWPCPYWGIQVCARWRKPFQISARRVTETRGQ